MRFRSIRENVWLLLLIVVFFIVIAFSLFGGQWLCLCCECSIHDLCQIEILAGAKSLLLTEACRPVIEITESFLRHLCHAKI